MTKTRLSFMIREADLTPIEKFLVQYSNIVSEFDKMTESLN